MKKNSTNTPHPSFLQKMNSLNYGKRAAVLSYIAIAVTLVIKLFIVPLLSKHYSNNAFITGKLVIRIVENVAILNVIIFFICILFLRKQIGHKVLYYMQLQNTQHFTHKWIGHWLQSLLICLVIIGITTFISATLFGSWGSYLFFVVLILIPFLLRKQLMALQARPR